MASDSLAVRFARADLPEPPRPGDLTQERLVANAAEAADKLWASLARASLTAKETGDWEPVYAILLQLRYLDADTRMAGAILGMLSPWLPILRDTPEGTPKRIAGLQLGIKGLDDILPQAGGVEDRYRWPTLEDAIRWLVDSRVQGRDALQALHNDLRRRAFSEAIQSDQRLLAKIQEALAETTRDGESLPDFRARLEPIVDVSRHEAETLYRTNTKQAYLYGQERTLDQPRVRDRFRWVYYAATQDNRTRPWHWALDGWVAERGTALHRVFLKVQSEFNCMLPGTRVAGQVVAAMRSRYGGKAIEVITESGSEIRVTENHPVLTENGWVRAGSLKQGDQLLRHVVEAEIGGVDLPVLGLLPRTANVDQEPAVVEEVFASLAAACGPERRECAAGDLHGDGAFVQGDIEIVRPAGELLCAGETVRPDQVGDLVFEPSLAGFVGPDDLVGPRPVGHPGPLHTLRLGSTAGLDSLLLQPKANSVAGNAVEVGDSLDRFSAVEPCDDVGVREGAFGPGWHPELGHPAADGLGTATKLLCDLKDSQAGLVRRDKVTAVRLFEFTGHVYDLQTITGVIVANDHLVSNCRCTLIPCDEKRALQYGIKTAADLPGELRKYL